VWETTVNGRALNFHLAGINNQNFIMQDEETGTWWQQVSGEAILGPLKGHRLRSVFHDELSFDAWRQERPNGRVLRPSSDTRQAAQYVSADWEEEVRKLPVATLTALGSQVEPRTLVSGISVNGSSKAYLLETLKQQSPVLDNIGGTPIVILVGRDERSVRAFERSVDGRELEIYAKTAGSSERLVDAETGSEWDFEGKAIEGPLAGRNLRKVQVLNDYWFDWKTYHPETSIYH
jgi:hypothetical protein